MNSGLWVVLENFYNYIKAVSEIIIRQNTLTYLKHMKKKENVYE